MTVENLTIHENISMYLLIVCSTIVILINLLLIKPILKKEKYFSQVTLLSLLLFLSIILSCCFLVITLLRLLKFTINCHLFYIFYPLCGIPSELSALSITINSYLQVTNNQSLLSRKKLTIIIFILITWIPPLLFVFLYYFFIDDVNLKTCEIMNDNYIIFLGIPQIVIEFLGCIICIILLIIVCRLKTKNDEVLKKSKRKIILKIFSFILGIILFVVIKNIVFGNVLPHNVKLYSHSLFCLYFLLFEFIFVWNKQIKDNIYFIYCCKNNNAETTVISETQDIKELMKYSESN